MAKFGIDVTKMSDPSLQGASHISEGVIDRSGGMKAATTGALLTNVLSIGKETYQGYTLAEQEKEIEQAIQDYTDTRDTSSIFSGEDKGKEAPIINSNLVKDMKRLKAAKERGTMSPDEFNIRVRSSLKQAINENPNLTQDFIHQTKLTLELSGVGDLIQQDIKAVKDRQEYIDNAVKDMQSRAKANNIYYDITTPYWELAQKVQKAEQDNYNYQTWSRGKDYAKQMTEDQAISWVDNNMDSVIRGGLDNFSQNILALGTTAEGEPQSYSQIKAQASIAGESMKTAFLQSIPPRLRGNPTVIQSITSFNNGIDNTLKTLEGLGSGEDWKKALSNNVEILKASQQKHVRETVNVEAINMTLELAKAYPNYFATEEKARNAIYNSLLQLGQGNFKAPVVDSLLPKTPKDMNLANILDGAAKIGKTKGDYSSLNTMVDGFNKKVIEINDPVIKGTTLVNNLKVLSKADMPDLDIDTINKINTQVSLLMDDSLYGVSSMFRNLEKNNSILHVLNDGKLYFEGGNAKWMNERFGVSLNAALGAYARAQNKTIKEVAPRFMQVYLGPYVTKETNASVNNP